MPKKLFGKDNKLPSATRATPAKRKRQAHPRRKQIFSADIPDHRSKLLIINKILELKEGDGAESRTRTDDLLITDQLLYQLSYFGLPLVIVPLCSYSVKPAARNSLPAP